MQPRGPRPRRSLYPRQLETPVRPDGVDNDFTDNIISLTTSGVSFKACSPDTAARTNGRDVCRDDENCLRTDLRADKGICVAAQTCNATVDCRDPERSTCMSDVIRKLAPMAELNDNQLLCLQEGCDELGKSCPLGEACLRRAYGDATDRIPDICVPFCDNFGGCPPNFACSRNYSPTSPPICAPGVPGVLCDHDVNCLLGTCEAVRDGGKICRVPCKTHGDCASLALENWGFFCAGNVAADQGFCSMVRLHKGIPCASDRQCETEPGTFCSKESPDQETTPEIGSCRKPCRENDTCADEAGVPFECLDTRTPSCFPAQFGLSCRTPGTACIEDAQCTKLVKGPSPVEARRARYLGVPLPENICTIPCDTDAECFDNRMIRSRGFCHDGTCRPTSRNREPCLEDRHCTSGQCGPISFPGITPDDVAAGFMSCAGD